MTDQEEVVFPGTDKPGDLIPFRMGHGSVSPPRTIYKQLTY